jgi:tetratricopeptide (TPR) repeat protein
MNQSGPPPFPPIPPPPPERFAYSAAAAARRRRLVWFAIAGLGVVLLLFAGLVGAGLLAYRASMVGATRVTKEPAAGEASRQSAAAFSGFDALTDSSALAPADRNDRQAIERLLRALETAASMPENRQIFQARFDLDRHIQRIADAGLIRLRLVDRRSLRQNLKHSAEPYWARLTLIQIVQPTDDPDSRIVYVIGRMADDNEDFEARLWIGLNGDEWKLYDWERLDHGLPESRRYAILLKHERGPLINGYSRWAELIAAALNHDDPLRARATLRLAEDTAVPPEMQDYVWLLTAYHWQAIGANDEALRCYQRIVNPPSVPGMWFGQMSCLSDSDPTQAVELGLRYQRRVGPSPSLCRLLASLLARTGRREESLAQWRKLLEFEPSDMAAWSALLQDTAAEGRPALLARLDRLPAPADTAAALALDIGWRNEEVLRILVDYARSTRPDSPSARRLEAYQRQVTGDLEGAAELYQALLAGPADQQTREACQEAQVGMSAELGQEVEVYQSAADPAAAFETFGYMADEGEIADVAMRKIVELHRERFPDDVDGVLRAARLAIDDLRPDEAERLLRALIEKRDPADETAELDAEQETTEQEDAEQYDAEQSDTEQDATRQRAIALLASALHGAGRWREAYESWPPRRERFSQLAWECQSRHQWSDLRALVDLHRQHEPGDPRLAEVEGQLAEQARDWNAALGWYRRAGELAAAEAGPDEMEIVRQRFHWQILNAAVAAGQWPEYYRQAFDRREAFRELAERLAQRADWDHLAELSKEHAAREPDDPWPAYFQVRACWSREDFEGCAQRAAALLQQRPLPQLEPGTWNAVQLWWLASLRRLDRLEEARPLLSQPVDASTSPTNATLCLAFLEAAAGNHAEATALASRWIDQQYGTHDIYHDAEFGRLFWSPEFEELQQRHPPGLSIHAWKLALLYFQDPPAMDEERVRQAWLACGGAGDVAPVALAGDVPGVLGALVFPEVTGVWVAWGEGRPADWSPGDPAAPLAKTWESATGWLAAGTFGGYDGTAERGRLARELAIKLAEGRAVLAAESEIDPHFPASAAVLSVWQQDGQTPPLAARLVTDLAGADIADLGSRTLDDALTPASTTLPTVSGLLEMQYHDPDQPATLDEHRARRTAHRAFDRALDQAARALQTQSASLALQVEIGGGPARERLWIDGASAKRSYGNWTFSGALTTASRAAPMLRTGLPVEVSAYSVLAFRAGDAPPVERPR